MSRHDLTANIDLVTAIVPATSGNAAVVSATIDIRGYETIGLIVAVGVQTLQLATVAWTMENSFDAGTSWVAVQDTDMINPIGNADVVATATTASSVLSTYIGDGDAIRVTATVAGNTGVHVVPISAFVLRAEPARKPVWSAPRS